MIKSDVQAIIREAPAEFINTDELIPYKNNAKKHPEEQINKIAESIRRFGWNSAKAIEIDRNNVIINGHGRRLAAIKLGMKKVPVVKLSELSDEEVRAYRLSDNEVAKSDFDTGLLAAELEDLHVNLGYSLDGIYDERDLEFAVQDIGEIDLGAIADDISSEVESQASATSDHIADEDRKTFPVGKVLGFTQCNARQQRTLALLMSHAEQVTQETGAEALHLFALDFVGLGDDS